MSTLKDDRYVLHFKLRLHKILFPLQQLNIPLLVYFNITLFNQVIIHTLK
jgi:hypothetical protein